VKGERNVKKEGRERDKAKGRWGAEKEVLLGEEDWEGKRRISYKRKGRRKRAVRKEIRLLERRENAHETIF
jgi:hypothetical protein